MAGGIEAAQQSRRRWADLFFRSLDADFRSVDRERGHRGSWRDHHIHFLKHFFKVAADASAGHLRFDVIVAADLAARLQALPHIFAEVLRARFKMLLVLEPRLSLQRQAAGLGQFRDAWHRDWNYGGA